jgi:hypothetical protein
VTTSKSIEPSSTVERVVAHEVVALVDERRGGGAADEDDVLRLVVLDEGLRREIVALGEEGEKLQYGSLLRGK